MCCAGHLSLTICDTSLLAKRRRELQNLAQMATYTMSLLNSKPRPQWPMHCCVSGIIIEALSPSSHLMSFVLCKITHQTSQQTPLCSRTSACNHIILVLRSTLPPQVVSTSTAQVFVQHKCTNRVTTAIAPRQQVLLLPCGESCLCCKTPGRLKEGIAAGAESSLAGAEQQWNDAMKVIEDKLQVRQCILHACISKFTCTISQASSA